MSFGPDIFEDEPTQKQPVQQSRGARNRNAVEAKSGTGVYVAIVLGLILGVLGMTYGSLIAPNADGVIKLVAFGIGVVGFIVLFTAFKKLRR